MSTTTTSSLLTARALILLQLLSRLLTFGLNQALVRLAPPEVFGTAAIQFDLICSTTLFLSREGIRNALLRSPNKPASAQTNDLRRTQDKRLAIVPFWLGIAVSTLTVAVYLARLPLSTSQQKDFHLSLGLYVMSALLELAIEPHYIAALRACPAKIRVRVQAEGGMAITKAVVTVGCVVAFEKLGQRRPLLAFAVGQATGAVWLVGRYMLEFGGNGLVWTSSKQGQKLFDDDATSLAVANMRQSVVKHVLTEADRIAVGIICPLEDQGGYAVAMNYARIIFQPLEETLLLHFSASPTSAASIRLLTLAIRLSSHLLLLLPAFLPPLLPALTPLLLPRRYLSTSAPEILETYLKAYIPLLSLNGVLEAYHAATATPSEVKTQIKWMVGSSMAFVGALVLSTRGGSSGQTETTLIYASCLAMMIRITYASLHARRRATATGGEMRLLSIIPRKEVVGAAVASGFLLRKLARIGRWQEGWVGRGELIGTGAALGLSTLAVIFVAEREDVLAVWKGKTA